MRRKKITKIAEAGPDGGVLPPAVGRGRHGGRGTLGRPSKAEIEREARRLAEEAEGLSGWRVPKEAPPAARKLADYALVKIKDVSEGRISFRLAPSVLRAAAHLREEVCGPIPQSLALTGRFDLGAALDRIDAAKTPPVVDVSPLALPEHVECQCSLAPGATCHASDCEEYTIDGRRRDPSPAPLPPPPVVLAGRPSDSEPHRSGGLAFPAPARRLPTKCRS